MPPQCAECGHWYTGREFCAECAPTCVWTVTADGVWETGCGHAHVFETAGPRQNRYEFCPYCGHNLSATVRLTGRERNDHD